MKNKLLIGLLLLGCITLVGCDNSNGKTVVDDEWLAVAEGYCNDEGGKVQAWKEGNDSQSVCFYEEDESYCYLEDLYNGLCNKGELYYYDGHDFPTAEQVCIDNGGNVTVDEQGIPICLLGGRGINLADMEEYTEQDYAYAQQACMDSYGQVSQNDDGEEICIFNDEYCYMSDIVDGACDLLNNGVHEVVDEHEEERVYQESVAECYQQENTVVCGKDGNAYYNRCFLEKNGIEEETEFAQVIDGKCIYG